MAKTKIKANKTLLNIVKRTFGRYLNHKFDVSIENPQAVSIKPPYVLLANHTNFWDPFLLSYYIKEPVYYITSDEYFRVPALRMLLRQVGAIPKSKFISDQATVKDIIHVKKIGGIVGIFPEGKRNWDGCTDELLFATAKLIKSLKVPVVTALLQGAYLSYPRWAKNSRKGRIVIKFEKTLETDTIELMSAQEIGRIISGSLAYCDNDFQKSSNLSFEGRDLAENLELFLFICPRCHEMCTLSSKGDELTCDHCGNSVIYEKNGRLHGINGSAYFETLGDWKKWQSEYLKGLLRTRADAHDQSSVFEDQNVTVKRGKRLLPLKKINFGHLTLFDDKIEFTGVLKRRLSFLIDKIHGINVQYNNQFEFYYENTLFRFSFKFAKTSAYKWVEAVRLIKELQGKLILTD